MHCRVGYLLDFDLKIRSGQACNVKAVVSDSSNSSIRANFSHHTSFLFGIKELSEPGGGGQRS